MARIAVIGAGISGLTAANALRDAGHDPVVFEKSRGPGGRMSTRRQDGFQFDHGAQYFTARGDAFGAAVDGWVAEGVASPWTGKVVAIDGNDYMEMTGRRFVGTPGMSAICQALANDLEVHWETRVAPFDASLDLLDEDGVPLGAFDALICSAPAVQSAALLAEAAPDLADQATRAEYAPCWAVMLGGTEDLNLTFDAAAVANSPVAWFARNSTKPGRPKGETWVLHATPDWSREHLEDDSDDVLEALFDAWTDIVGNVDPKFATAHRWRYAQVAKPLGLDAIIGDNTPVVACGDWCVAPRVESAFDSGRAASALLLERLG